MSAVGVTFDGASWDSTVSPDSMRWQPEPEPNYLTWADIPGLVRGLPAMTS
jgi:hypothetical protein